MSPKYRGDSDSWFDDHSPKEIRRGPKSKIKKKSDESKQNRFLPFEEGNGTVVEVFPDLCKVNFEDGKSHLCGYKRALVQKKAASSGIRERSPVCVGDRVLATLTGSDTGVVEGVCERKNSLSRIAPGDGESIRVHVIVSNLDLLVVVGSKQNPSFNPGLVDRFLIAGLSSNIPVLLCLNKMDLPEEEGAIHSWEKYRTFYESLGVQILELSCKKDVGMTELEAEVKGKRVAFCGHSGVGKTSLLRKLTGFDLGKIGEVSDVTGKGKHTTSASTLFHVPRLNAELIDTPGVREFALHGISQEELLKYFPEFQGQSCKVSGCLHLKEEGCGVRGLPRYVSYHKMMESIV